MGIQVYHHQDVQTKLNNTILKELQARSQKVAEQKELVVEESWHLFFSKVYDNIINDKDLAQVLYKTQEDFYLEDAHYDDLSKLDVQSNQIKLCLHKILTKAIFEYCLCKDLLNSIRRKDKPKPEDWIGDSKKWLSLGAKPFHLVSDFSQSLFNCGIYLTNIDCL